MLSCSHMTTFWVMMTRQSDFLGNYQLKLVRRNAIIALNYIGCSEACRVQLREKWSRYLSREKTQKQWYLCKFGISSGPSGQMQAISTDPYSKLIHCVTFTCRKASIDKTKHAYTESDSTWPKRTTKCKIQLADSPLCFECNAPEDL